MTFSLKTDHVHSVKAVETKDGSYTLWSEQFGATYHAVQGATEESRHVFINNGLLALIHEYEKKELNILEIGFGTGLNAFLTFLEAKKSALTINYHAVELYPVPVNIIPQLNFAQHCLAEEQAIFFAMHEKPWNQSHWLYEQFCLTKHLEAIEAFQSDGTFDLIYFDAFSPKEQPELWTESVFKSMFSLLNTNGRLVTYCAQGQMKRNMKAAGFKVKALKGFAAKREMTVGNKW